MLGAWTQALGGHAAAAERWGDAGEQGSYEGMLPDDSTSIEGWRALLRAKLCRRGVAQMRADAELALTLIPVGSLWRAPATLLLGISHLLAGDLGVADRVVAQAVEVAQDTGATVAASVALAERAMLAVGRQDWQAAQTLVDQARSVVKTRTCRSARLAWWCTRPGPGWPSTTATWTRPNRTWPEPSSCGHGRPMPCRITPSRPGWS